MSYDKDLLDQALFLATKEPKRPKQASLRRAVSSAYYSLFHFIIEGVSVQVLRNDTVIRIKTNRKFEHKNLRDVSSRYRSSTNAEIASLAMTVHNLMDARHNADYNLFSKITRNDVLGYIDETRCAVWTSSFGVEIPPQARDDGETISNLRNATISNGLTIYTVAPSLSRGQFSSL